MSARELTEATLRTAVTDLYFESNVTPRIHVEDPFGPVNPSAVGRVVRPKVTFAGPLIGTKSVAPWGDPSPTAFPLTVALIAFGLLGLGYYAWKGIACR